MSTTIGFEEDMGQGSRNYGQEAMLRKVGELARRRREELGFGRVAFAQQTGIGSDKTIQDFEKGVLKPRPHTLSLFEAGLGWRVGSVTELIDDPKRKVSEVSMEDLDAFDRKPDVTELSAFSTIELLDEVRNRFMAIQEGLGGRGRGRVKLGPADLYGLAASGGHKPEHLDDNPDDGIDGLNVSPN